MTILIQNGAGAYPRPRKAAAHSAEVSLVELQKRIDDFSKARNWEHFHSPRNLLLALVGEVGELSEIFQWKGEVQRGLPGWDASEREHLGEELSDVLLYLVRLSDMCGVDLGRAALSKLEKNAIKYPVERNYSTTPPPPAAAAAAISNRERRRSTHNA
ncbi:hypothetical protein O6H91_05G097400 [Diphasiastrum complanatum]|uniref:Uncharacterized protein n=2 Tax=Diphasiastrum complanatum TaxID=34168 RepID=A0ACC2DR82_DIPCM|nr:hypothetical protein O6H91_05G093900 [Diphasiastrum complanatum]KAJ7556771.1 hypothetical protein O6H91_05G097400 [Diphasiastrum complanatum]